MASAELVAPIQTLVSNSSSGPELLGRQRVFPVSPHNTIMRLEIELSPTSTLSEARKMNNGEQLKAEVVTRTSEVDEDINEMRSTEQEEPLDFSCSKTSTAQERLTNLNIDDDNSVTEIFKSDSPESVRRPTSTPISPDHQKPQPESNNKNNNKNSAIKNLLGHYDEVAEELPMAAEVPRGFTMFNEFHAPKFAKHGNRHHPFNSLNLITASDECGGATRPFKNYNPRISIVPCVNYYGLPVHHPAATSETMDPRIQGMLNPMDDMGTYAYFKQFSEYQQLMMQRQHQQEQQQHQSNHSKKANKELQSDLKKAVDNEMYASRNLDVVDNSLPFQRPNYPAFPGDYWSSRMSTNSRSTDNRQNPSEVNSRKMERVSPVTSVYSSAPSSPNTFVDHYQQPSPLGHRAPNDLVKLSRNLSTKTSTIVSPSQATSPSSSNSDGSVGEYGGHFSSSTNDGEQQQHQRHHHHASTNSGVASNRLQSVHAFDGHYQNRNERHKSTSVPSTNNNNESAFTTMMTDTETNSNGKRRGRSLPEELKDDAYWERRRKNNEAAKRSRDARRAKEDEIAIRAAYLEQENLKLRVEVTALKTETAKLRCLLYNS